MPDARAPLCLIACDDAKDLGTAMAARLGIPVTPSHDVWFACGEGKHVVDANVRGCDVYLVQRPVVPGAPHSLYDRWTMLLHAVDAVRYADAARVTVVVPYLPGARQDKRKGREGISTSLFARILEAAGVNMVVTVEPHNEAIAGCFNPRECVFEGVSVVRAFAEHLGTSQSFDVVAAPDVGRLEVARGYAEILGSELVGLSKVRDYRRANHVEHATLLGEVAGRSVLLVDDIVDTGGSVVAAVRTLWAAGATDITVAGVHCIMSGPAWERMNTLRDEATKNGVRFTLVGTSSVIHPDAPDYYRSFSLDALLADVVRSVNTRGSLHALLHGSPA